MTPARAQAPVCPDSGVVLQVLGSGGPGLNRFRASTAYLLWVDGKARLLVDMGGGAQLRFAQSGAELADLALIAISHLHPDHVADLPALLWLSDRRRDAPLPIVGPAGNAATPGLTAFLQRLFDRDRGAFPMMGATLGQGSAAGVRLEPRDIAASATPTAVWDSAGLRITARGIPHGDVPTLAYRVEVQGKTIVFGSDQTGADAGFADFARGADLLLLHLTLQRADTGGFHAGPDVVGQMAQASAPKQVVLAHIGNFRPESAVEVVQRRYAGPLTVAADLQCTAVR